MLLTNRFGLTTWRGQTLEELGIPLGVTRDRVRQIEARALAKLRNPRLDGGLRSFLATPYDSMARRIGIELYREIPLGIIVADLQLRVGVLEDLEIYLGPRADWSGTTLKGFLEHQGPPETVPEEALREVEARYRSIVGALSKASAGGSVFPNSTWSF